MSSGDNFYEVEAEIVRKMNAIGIYGFPKGYLAKKKLGLLPKDQLWGITYAPLESYETVDDLSLTGHTDETDEEIDSVLRGYLPPDQIFGLQGSLASYRSVENLDLTDDENDETVEEVRTHNPSPLQRLLGVSDVNGQNNLNISAAPYQGNLVPDRTDMTTRRMDIEKSLSKQITKYYNEAKKQAEKELEKQRKMQKKDKKPSMKTRIRNFLSRFIPCMERTYVLDEA